MTHLFVRGRTAARRRGAPRRADERLLDRLPDVAVAGHHPRERGGERRRACRGTSSPGAARRRTAWTRRPSRPVRATVARGNVRAGVGGGVRLGLLGGEEGRELADPVVVRRALRPASRPRRRRGGAARPERRRRDAAGTTTTTCAGPASRRCGRPRRPRRRHRCARARSPGHGPARPRPAARRSPRGRRPRSRPGRRPGRRAGPGPAPPRRRSARWRRSRARRRSARGGRRPRGRTGRTARAPRRSRRRAWRPQRIATAPLTTPSDSICAVRETSA